MIYMMLSIWFSFPKVAPLDALDILLARLRLFSWPQAWLVVIFITAPRCDKKLYNKKLRASVLGFLIHIP